MKEKITFLDCCMNNYYGTETLEIGEKNGCITVIGNTEHYDKEEKEKAIESIEKAREQYLETHPVPEKEKMDYFEDLIEDNKKITAYLGKCECGNLVYVSKKVLYETEHTSCGRNCKLK